MANGGCGVNHLPVGEWKELDEAVAYLEQMLANYQAKEVPTAEEFSKQTQQQLRAFEQQHRLLQRLLTSSLV